MAAETVMEPVDVGPFLLQLVQVHGWSDRVRVLLPCRPTSDGRLVAPLAKDEDGEAPEAGGVTPSSAAVANSGVMAERRARRLPESCPRTR